MLILAIFIQHIIGSPNWSNWAMGFPSGSIGKESACKVEDQDSVPG